MTPPRILVANRQRTVRLDLPAIRSAIHAALPDCLASARAGAPILHLAEIFIGIVSDSAISRVHGEFLNDPTPTDVITFDHGEILIGAAEAARNAAAFACGDPSRETALCAIHGLLHLGGWTDKSAADAREMHAVQDRIHAAAWRSS